MMRSRDVALLALALPLGAVAAQNRPSAEAFRFERPIVPGAAGPNRLEVDVPLLVGAQPLTVRRRGRLPQVTGGLSDLRLYDLGGREVPYRLVAKPRRAGRATPQSALTAPLRIERRPSEPGRSRYRIRLPGTKLPIVALELEVGGDTVLRDARVTETRLSHREMTPVLLGRATLRRPVRGNATTQKLRIPLSSPSQAELELVLDDGSNPPLDLVAINATFAPLPFIYFESERGEALVARYGQPRVKAPRYDLEPVRDSSYTIASARWGEPRESAPPAAALETVALHRTGPAVDARAFRWTRTIPAGAPGLTALTLDAAVLAHSRAGDLRIARADGRQVPYILERLEEPVRLDLPVLEFTPEPSATGSEFSTPGLGSALSYYRLHIPYDSLPPSRLVLTTPARVFRRQLRVEVVRPPATHDGRPGGGGWRETVASATWTHADDRTPALPLTLELPAMQSAEAYLVVDEGDNSPLAIAPPTLLLPTYRLRFYRDRADAPLSLLYGHPGLGAPAYDVALASALLGAAAVEVAPGAESTRAAAVLGRIARMVFWTLLAVAVLAPIALIGRSMKKGSFAAGSAATPQTPGD